jgi:BolA family transcriptional regulator, general stress-responsive regulator
MSMEQQMKTKLEGALAPLHLSLWNESHKHSVPKGSESHWNVVVVSGAFEGKNPLARHRAVYSALGEELKAGIHALTLKALTPSEWEAAGGTVSNPSPKCHGGSKRTTL